uniref:Uncharacterized protein n=1 Tax=Plectus sambesii TaxID=2011161 RepID=A0A914VAU4_9BILA
MPLIAGDREAGGGAKRTETGATAGSRPQQSTMADPTDIARSHPPLQLSVSSVVNGFVDEDDTAKGFFHQKGSRGQQLATTTTTVSYSKKPI